MVMRTKAFIIFLFLFVFSFQCLAHDTDLYVLDQSMEQVPPDILFVLDLSGSMRYTPAGEYMYIPDSASCSSSYNCPNNRAMPFQSIATVRAQDLFIRPTAARTRIVTPIAAVSRSPKEPSKKYWMPIMMVPLRIQMIRILSI